MKYLLLPVIVLTPHTSTAPNAAEVLKTTRPEFPSFSVTFSSTPWRRRVWRIDLSYSFRISSKSPWISGGGGWDTLDEGTVSVSPLKSVRGEGMQGGRGRLIGVLCMFYRGRSKTCDLPLSSSRDAKERLRDMNPGTICVGEQGSRTSL